MQKKDLEVFLYCIISDIESTADQGKIEVGLLCHLIGFDQLVKPACVEAVVSKLSFLQDHNEMLHDSSEVSPDPELLESHHQVLPGLLPCLSPAEAVTKLAVSKLVQTSTTCNTAATIIVDP